MSVHLYWVRVCLFVCFGEGNLQHGGPVAGAR